MTTEAPPGAGGAPRRVQYATNIYVGLVAATGISLTAAAIRVDGLHINTTFWVMMLLGGLAWWFGSVKVDGGRVSLSFTSIVLLATMALVGPAAAGIVGTTMAPFSSGPGAPLRARIFNSGMFATMGVVGGAAYLSAGGVLAGAGTVGTRDIVRPSVFPCSWRTSSSSYSTSCSSPSWYGWPRACRCGRQVSRILGSSGPAHLGYGIIAFILVVLWGPVRLGPASVFLILPPLLVAHWAYRQYAEEVKAHERALYVLVAAVEAKAPHLAGHSSRVADLSASMAEHLLLRAHVVADTRVAGMLHDLGLTTLPTGLVRSTGVTGDTGLQSYPARGVRLLRGLSFLTGSLDAILHHRDALSPAAGPDQLSMPAMVVGLADEYDLLTEVGTPDGARVERDAALELLRRGPAGREDLLQALEHALSRRTVSRAHEGRPAPSPRSARRACWPWAC